MVFKVWPCDPKNVTQKFFWIKKCDTKMWYKKMWPKKCDLKNVTKNIFNFLSTYAQFSIRYHSVPSRACDQATYRAAQFLLINYLYLHRLYTIEQTGTNSWRASAFFCSFVFLAAILFLEFVQTVHMNFHAKSGVCSSKNGWVMSTFVLMYLCTFLYFFLYFLYFCTIVIYLDYPYELPCKIWSL